MKRNFDTIKEIFNVCIAEEGVLVSLAQLEKETKIDNKEIQYHIGLMIDQDWLKTGSISEIYRMSYKGHEFYDNYLDGIIDELKESE